MKVIIESPYAGEQGTKEEIETNVRYCRAAMRDCLLRREAPYASHVLYTQEGVFDDKNPEERKLGIEAGLAWGEMAEMTVVYTDRGMSKGMKQGVERAQALGRPVEYRSLPAWAKK